MVKRLFIFLQIFLTITTSQANSILIPMDGIQKNHLKAYGITYYMLLQNITVDWLLNYRGGNFLAPYSQAIQNECTIRGISIELISTAQSNTILQEI